jgi:deazaflavin-dependent oxidoreductase (nitroreductase family)
VLIASVGGAPRHPGWYHNLQGQEAEVQIGSERRRVRARDAEGEERERLWAEMVSLYPNYAEYQKKTTRLIPVVVLEPA